MTLLPPIAFLIAIRFVTRRPTAQYPYGYHRTISVAHVVAGAALLAMGGYLIVDSAMGLIAAEHPPIGSVELFGITMWMGWVMILVMVIVAIPPVILGRIKLKLAPLLHDKVLYADAQMNKADWMTALATCVGILGIGIGLWWADAVAAIFISFSIITDGWKNLRDSITDLIDHRASTYDGREPDPLHDENTMTLLGADWVAEASCRLRDQGHVVHAEAFVVPSSGEAPSLAQLEALRQECIELSWRVQDIVLAPVAELPKELLPQIEQ